MGRHSITSKSLFPTFNSRERRGERREGGFLLKLSHLYCLVLSYFSWHTTLFRQHPLLIANLTVGTCLFTHHGGGRAAVTLCQASSLLPSDKDASEL